MADAYVTASLGDQNQSASLLRDLLSDTPIGSSRWIHHSESGLSLEEFQAVHALAEEWESVGRLEILETHEETETRRSFTDAIKLRRLK
jgi:hypothetical protein